MSGPKFPNEAACMLRVAHVALVQAPDSALMAAAERFAANPAIDALIMDSIHGRALTVIGRAADRVRGELGRGRLFPRPDVMPTIFARPSMRGRD
jgi:hypothetical protein